MKRYQFSTLVSECFNDRATVRLVSSLAMIVSYVTRVLHTAGVSDRAAVRLVASWAILGSYETRVLHPARISDTESGAKRKEDDWWMKCSSCQ